MSTDPIRFPIPQRPANDSERTRALREFEILDTQPEEFFDNITRLATHITDCPVSVISLIDAERQWFKAKIGVDYDECPRDESFCAHTVYYKKPFIVENTLLDERFVNHPAVLGNPGVRFYAGIPLITGGGHAIGSLCVADSRPRQLEQPQFDHLVALAQIAIGRIESALTARRLASALSQMKEIRGLLPICCHCKGIRDDQGYWQSVERYMDTHADVDFTHTICPGCIAEHHPGYTAR